MKRSPYISKGAPKKGIAPFKYSEKRDLLSLSIPPTLITAKEGVTRKSRLKISKNLNVTRKSPYFVLWPYYFVFCCGEN